MIKNKKSYRKLSVKRTPPPTDSAWFKNASSSMRKVAFDVFSDIMPATAETIVSTKQGLSELKKEYMDINRKVRSVSAEKLVMGKDILKNSLEDLKSGNFYNKARMDAHDEFNMDDMFDGMDLDFDDSSSDSDFDMSISSDDGNAFMEMAQSSNGDTQYTQINVDMNLDEDSTLVQATNAQTEVSIKNSQQMAEISTRNTQILMAQMSKVGSSLVDGLSAINDNVAQITTVVSESLTANMSVANQYYEDSLAIFTEMNEKMTTISDSMTKMMSGGQTETEVSDYKSVLDSFGDKGGIDFTKYVDLVKKQGKNAFDSSMLGVGMSMLKMASGMGASEWKESPISFLMKNGIKSLIPNVVKTTLSSLDEQFKETAITSLVRLGGLRNSSNPLLSMLGNIFGIRNSKYNVNKENYNKEPMAWNGIAHRTLVDVIPTYLSQIAAAVTGTEQKVFDYKKGTYRSLEDVRKEYKEDEDFSMMSPYSGIQSKFSDFLNKFEFDSYDEQERYEKGFNDYIRKIIKNPGTMNFNDTEQTIDAVGGDENIAKMVQQFMRYAPKNMVTAAYGRNALEAVANVSRRNKEIEKDPTAYNGQYVDNGMTVISPSSGTGLLRKDVDSKDRDKFWYLERILKTINTVVPVRIIEGGEAFNLAMLGELGAVTVAQNITHNPPTPIEEEDTENQTRETNGTKLSLDSVNDSPEELREKIDGISGDTENPKRESKLLKFLKGIGAKEDSNVYKFASNLVSTKDRALGGASSTVNKIGDGLFSLLFSNDPNERGVKGLVNTIIDGAKDQFKKFSTFMDEKVIGPMNESLFGEEGFITKLSESETMKKFKDQLSNIKAKATNFLFGEPDEDGVRHNGIFSETLNSLRDMGTSAKDFIFKDENGVVASMKRIFHDTTTSIKNAIGIDEDSPTAKMSFSERIASGASDFLTHIQKRGSEWVDMIFGPSTKDSQSELRDAASVFMEDMKGKKGKLMASSAVGFLGSFFLPGGPITGALLGLGTGIVSESTQLKDFLFGEKGEDGERLDTGLISKGVQDFFKDNKVGLSVGAFGGLISSVGLLPSFFFPGGPIGGALLGGAVSLAHKSGMFNDLIYGEDGSKDNITGGITKFIKDHYKKDANIKSTFMDAGMGAGVGILGSFFLPGGPITGALLGAASNIAINTDKFKDMLFGKEEVDKDGNKTGKRSGGLFGKFTSFLSKNVMAPLTVAAKKTQIKLMVFVEKNMLNPLKASLEPFRVAGKEFLDGVKGVLSDIKNAFLERVTKPITDAVKVHILDPMKNAFKNIFSGVGKIIGSIISAPFKAIQGTAESLNKSQVKRGVSDYDMAAELEKLNRRTEIKQTFLEAELPTQEEAESGWWNPFKRKKKDNGEETTVKADDNSGKKEKRYRGSRSKGKERAKKNQKKNSGETSTENTTTETTTKISEEELRNEAITATSENTKESTDHLRNIREVIQNIANRLNIGTGRRDQTTSESTESNNTTVSDTRQMTSMRSQSGSTQPTNNTGTTQSTSEENQTRISEEDGGTKPKKKNKTNEISTNVKKIADSVDGQLNGVGYNVNKILKVLLKKNGMSEDDVQGENNKKYSPFRKIKNLLLSPVRALKSMVNGVKKAVKDTITGVVKGVVQIGKGLLAVPKMLLKTAGNAIKAIGPAIGTVVKGAASLIGSGLKAAGNVIEGAAVGLGKMISGASEGFGKLVGGALGGLGSLLHGVGLIGKELAPVIGKAISGIIQAPFKLVGAAGSLLKNIFGKKKGKKGGMDSHIIVDDILHQTGEERLFDQLRSIEDAILGIPSGSDESPTVPNIPDIPSSEQKKNKAQYDESDDNTKLRVPLNAQFFASSSKSKKSSSTTPESTGDKEKDELNTRVSEGSAESMKDKFQQEDDAEADKSFKEKLLSLIHKNNDDQEKHTSIWSSIFSKKGLITGALLLAAPLIIKHLPTIMNAIKGIADIVGKIFEGLGKDIGDQGGVAGVVNGGMEQVTSVTDAVGLTNRKEYAIGENGELLTDENGNAVKTEYTDDSLGTRISEFYTPTVTKVDKDTGELYQEYQYDGVSAAKLNQTRTVAHNVIKKVKKTTERASKAKNAVKGAGKKFLGGVESAAIHIDDLTGSNKATAAYDAVGSVKNSLTSKVKNAGASVKKSGSGFIEKIVGYIKDGFAKLLDKLITFVSEKAPGAASKCGKLKSFIDDIVKMVTKSSVIQKYAQKFSAFMTKVTTAASTLLTSDLAWGAVGFISGATNAGYTFEVDSKDVDWLMVAISGLFRGILNTSWASIVDIVASIVYEITGFNLVSRIAVMLYDAIMTFLGQSDKVDKLSSAREEFTEDYNAYQEEEYNAYVKNQEANGQTAMSFDEFKASDLATSKSEYNAQQNQSIFKKGFDAVKNGASRAGRGIKKEVTKVKTTVATGFTMAKNKVTDKVNSVKATVGTGITMAKTKVKETWDNSKLKTFVDGASNVGKFLIDGVKSQLKYAWTGDDDDLLKLPSDEDDPSTATKKIVLIGTKVMLSGITTTIRAARLTFEFVKKTWDNIKNLGKIVKDSASARISAAMKGEDYQSVVADTEDNPLGKIGVIADYGTGIMMSPVTTTISIAKKMFDFTKSMWVTVKALGAKVKNSITGRISAAWNGETYESAEVDESNPLSKIGASIDMISGVMLSPIIPTISGVRLVYESVKKAWDGVKTVATTIKNSVTGRISAAWKGETYEPTTVDDEGNPLGKLGAIVDFGLGYMMSPVTFTVSMASAVVNKVKGFAKKFKDLAATNVAYQDVFNDKVTLDNYWKNPNTEDDGIFGTIKTLMFYVSRVSLAIPFYIGKAIGLVKDKIASVPKYLLKAVKALFGEEGAYTTEDETVETGGTGGQTPSNVPKSSMNGFTYYSQNDIRIKNQSYNESDGTPGTMGDRGCGPTALSMVATELTGQNYDPTSMAKIAERDGYSTEVGTTTGYFGSVGSRLGMNVAEGGANPDAIRTSLANGDPVILQGKGGGSNSPYTSQGHYVVGVGMDGDKVLVNDPRGPQYSKGYSMDDVMSGAGGMWSFSGGKGPGLMSQFNNPSNSTSTTTLPSLSDFNKSMSPIAQPSFLSNGSADTTTTSSQNNNEAAEQALVSAMYSVKDSLKYDMNGPRNPDQGSADCSSTVQWAYKKALGMDPGGNTRAQIADSSGYFVDTYSGGAPNEANLRPGDLLFYGKNGSHSASNVGHVEMYVGGNKLMGHGGGKHGEIPGPTEKTMSSYRLKDYIGAKRYMEGGNATVLNDFGGASSTGASIANGVAGTTSTDGTSDSSSGFSLSNFISGALNAVQEGVSNFFGMSKANASSNGTTVSGSTPSTPTGDGSTVVAANVSGGDEAQQIWNYFRQQGFTKEGTAGLMGNLEQESGNHAVRLQGDMTPPYAKSQEYTKQADSGANDFVHDSKGYGLAQWTYYTRKQGLLDAAKANGKSVGDLGLQLAYLNNELNTKYGSVLNTLKTATDIKTASNSVLHDFEAPKDQSASVENARASLAQGHYNQFANSESGGFGGKGGTKPTVYKSTPVRQVGGKGPNQEASSGINKFTIKAPNVSNFTEGTNLEKKSNNYMEKLFEYLGKIVVYMESTSSGISQLNQKDFGSNNTNYTSQSSYTNVNGSNGSGQQVPQNTSNYELGKMIARGQLV